MSTFKAAYGAINTYGIAAALAAGNYDMSGPTYDNGTNGPADVLFTYWTTPAANPTGNAQVVLFIVTSGDGLNWPALPTGPTDATHDTSVRQLGAIKMNNGASATEVQRQQFNVAALFGIMPRYWRVIVKNDCGVALSASGASTQELSATMV